MPSTANRYGGLQPSTDKQPVRIAGMFDAIAARYDLLNHVLSGGLDVYWRWRAVRRLQVADGASTLDLCAGTCDVARSIIRGGKARRVFAIDFSAEMLRVGRGKLEAEDRLSAIPLARGDAMAIPLADRSVDAVTIAFGIRNVQDPRMTLREVARVMKPGGRVAILEFSTPQLLGIRQAYLWYFRHVLPRVGRLISRHGEAYSYLPASVDGFAAPHDFVAQLEAAGFAAARAVPLTLGVVYLYVAQRP